MTHLDAGRFGGGIDDAGHLPIFHRGLLLKLQNCGIQLPKHAPLLDVGSGNGELLNYLREQGLDAEGVDTEPRGPGVNKADAAALPYASETFDCVMSKQAFDGAHYPQSQEDQRDMLGEIVRVLKRGGVYYAMENFFEPIAGLERLIDPSGSQASSLYRKSGLAS